MKLIAFFVMLFIPSFVNAQTASFTIEGDVFCYGDDFTVTNTSTGSPTSYAWDVNGSTSTIINAYSQNPIIFAFESGTLTLTLNNGSTFSQDFTVINEINAFTGPDAQICLGESVQLYAEATEFPSNDVTYKWTPSAGLDNPNIANPVATPQTTTVYSLTVSAGLCVPEQANVIIEVSSTPTGTFTATPTSGVPPLNVAFNFSLDDSTSQTDITIFDSNGIFIDKSSSLTTTFTEEGTYTYYAETSNSNCRFLDSATVIVSNTLSSNAHLLDNKISIQPNPLNTQSVLNIEDSNITFDLDLVSLLGQTTRQYLNQNNNLIISKENLDPGIYIAVIRDSKNHQILGSKKLIIN